MSANKARNLLCSERCTVHTILYSSVFWTLEPVVLAENRHIVARCILQWQFANNKCQRFSKVRILALPEKNLGLPSQFIDLPVCLEPKFKATPHPILLDQMGPGPG